LTTVVKGATRAGTGENGKRSNPYLGGEKTVRDEWTLKNVCLFQTLYRGKAISRNRNLVAGVGGSLRRLSGEKVFRGK